MNTAALSVRSSLVVMAILASTETLVAAQPEGTTPRPAQRTRDVSREELLDRIYGGWLGTLIGGLEGLPHEFKYKDQPRQSLPDFPLLPHGARADDDNDFELTHLYFMDKDGTLKIPYEKIAAIWKANMNEGIWVANKRARELMDQGLIPPATGDPKNNTPASFNLSGQFCVEAYGLVAPGMPQAAADMGIHYAHIAVSGEPIQAAQFWTALVSLNAFRTGTLEDVLEESLHAVDPSSAHAEVVRDAIRAYHDNLEDWKAARQIIHNKWLVEKKWNGNSTPTNGGLVVLALLYGKDDFCRTLQHAMALGHDADCNAATAGTIVGVRTGYRRIAALPDFHMPDVYQNVRNNKHLRSQLPKQMKISEQAELMLRLAERVILANGGRKIEVEGKPGYRIVLQDPKNLETLAN